jgi:DNA-binding PadR family transcriptional regulator
MKAYRARSGLDIPTGNFYRELARLLLDEDVEAAERAPSTDPRRAPYRITAEGERRFDRWLAARLRASDAERADDLALRVLVLPAADPDLSLTVLARWKQDLWLRAKMLESERDLQTRSQADDAGLRALLVQRRLGHLACDIELISALEVDLAEKRSGSTARRLETVQLAEVEVTTPTVARRGVRSSK